jgi:hypothetical protein
MRRHRIGIWLLVVGAGACATDDSREEPCGVADQVIVRFAQETTLDANLEVIEAGGDRVLRMDPEIHYFLLETAWPETEAIEYYRSRDDVRYALPNYCVQVTSGVP